MESRSINTSEQGLLEGWIAAFRGPLIGLLASWGRDWRAAEELAQDTFAEAWVSRGRFVGDFSDTGALGAWLRGIAFNLHNQAQRKAARHGPQLAEGIELEAPADDSDPRRAVLAAGFARLSASHQAVLRMHYLEETSAREVGALLGLTTKAVESRLYQARKALRSEIESMDEATDPVVGA